MNNHGFNLIEILIASSILASVLVGLALLMGSIIRSNSQANNRVMAGDLTQSGSDFFRQERKVLGFGRLKQELSSSSYCLNNTSQSLLDENELLRTQFNINNCDYAIEIDGTPTKFKRVAEISLSDDLIEILIITSWIADNNQVSEVSSALQLRPR